MRIILKSLLPLLMASTMAQAASFDCIKAASATEKLICGNESVSALDEQLGQAYKQAIANTENKDAIKQQQLEWLKQQRACKDAGCLTQHYQARIAQLQKMEASSVSGAAQAVGQTSVNSVAVAKKVNFKITEGKGEPLCEEMLKVLNRAAWDDLQACKLPDLTGSPIQPVVFTPLTGDALKEMDKLVYFKLTLKKNWEDIWSERKQEYEMGYRKLGEAYWDLDKDGKDDQIIKIQEPDRICESYSVGESSPQRKIIKEKWKNMSVNEKLTASHKHGFQKFYYVARDAEVIFVDAGEFVIFQSKQYSVWTDLLALKDTTNERSDKNWVFISGVIPKKDDVLNEYRETPSMCQFWLK